MQLGEQEGQLSLLTRRMQQIDEHRMKLEEEKSKIKSELGRVHAVLIALPKLLKGIIDQTAQGIEMATFLGPARPVIFGKSPARPGP